MKHVLILGVLVLLALPLAAAAAPPDKPNIIIMLIDDMGLHDGEPFGSRYFKTPQMACLAKEGAMFTQAYAACAVCSPTRAAMLTSRNPARLHITDYIPGETGGKNAVLKRFFQNHGLLGIISVLFEGKDVLGVCLPWLTSQRFSTIRNASFFPRWRPNSAR